MEKVSKDQGRGEHQEPRAASRHHTSSKLGTTGSLGRMRRTSFNRKKMEKSMFRKEGHMYVLDLFVRVLSSVAVPVTYKSIKSQMEESREGESRSTATAQLFDGGTSESGRQVPSELKP